MSLGTDFDAQDDITEDWALCETERLAFAQAMYRRLVTVRGTLFYARNYGLGILGYLLDTATFAQISNEIQAELIKDERVQFVAVVQRATDILIKVTPFDAPTFPLTLTIDKVTAEILMPETSA